MSFKSLKVSIENHIAHVVLDRPNELNSMNTDFCAYFYNYER